MYLDLIILDGFQAGRRIPVGRVPLTFGRSPVMTVAFPDDRFMSSTHVKVQHALSGLLVFDLRSSNGTFLNGERITQSMALPGDVIRIGSLTMQVAFGKAPPREPEPAKPAEPVAETTLLPVFVPEPPSQVPASDAERSPQELEGVLRVLREESAPMFCLLDTVRHEAARTLLALAPERRESLHSGEGVASPEVVPSLVQISRESDLLGALVHGGWYAEWSVFFTSAASFEEVAAHFQRFYRVQVEQGGDIYFRFYEPGVLREFFSQGSPGELTEFFGPVDEWLLPGISRGAVLRVSNAGSALRAEIVTIPASVPPLA